MFIEIKASNGLTGIICGSLNPLFGLETEHELFSVDYLLEAVACKDVSFADWHALAVPVEKTLEGEPGHYELFVMLVLEDVFGLRIVRAEHCLALVRDE